MDFTLNIDKKAQARINPGRCINCGECGRICPTDAISEYQKAVSGLFSANTRDMIESSCSVGCPMGIIPQTVASFVRSGQTAKAYKHIAERTPMPWVCSEVCTGPCYSHCKLVNVDEEPIDMHALEKASVRDGERINYDFTTPAYDKVAVIGGGPAGIMAAFELRRMGYRPVIFEKRDRLGGAMSWGIPDIRLDKKAMHAEIDHLIDTGIEVRYNYALGENFDISRIWSEGFAACLIATGKSRPEENTLKGANCKGVFQAIDLLRQINDGGYSESEKEKAPEGLDEMGEKIIVTGKGSLVTEAAVVLAAHGKDVTVLIDDEAAESDMKTGHKSLEEMGVKCTRITAVRQVISDADGVKALEIMNEDRPSNIFCDGIVVAFGRRSEVEHTSMVEASPEGVIRIDQAYRTNRERIYACGEVAGSRESVIEAMAQGRRAAFAIDRDLRAMGAEEDKAAFYPAYDGETIYPENILKDRDFRALGKPGEDSVEDIVSVLRSAGVQENMPVYFEDRGPEDDEGRKKVAVIGGGVAGIAASIAFAKRGVRATIFEKTSRLGGRCRWLSTNRRYDRDKMDRETAKVEAAGINVIYNASGGIRPDLAELVKEYDGVLLAIGESAPSRPEIPGAKATGAFDIVSLMKQLNNGRLPKQIGKKAVVIGSDDLSIDMARALKRFCEEVTLLTLCGKGKFQVTTSAARLVTEEGINLVTGVEVTEIQVKDGLVDGVKCNVISKGSSLGIPCDTVVFGEGKAPDLETLALRNLYLDLDEDGYVKTNSKLATNMRGVFAIGNFNMSSADAGRAGAATVCNYLFGENEPVVVETFHPEEMAVEHEMISGKTGIIEQQEAPLTLMDEGERCINCGYHQSDETRCIGCGICQKYCPTGAIWMEGIEDQTASGEVLR